MEEFLPIWKFCVEPSFPHLVEALRFLGASSSAYSVWVITPRLAINSCFSFCSGAQGREWQRIHHLLWHCNISTKVWKKPKPLTFNCSFVWLKSVMKDSKLGSTKCSLKTTLLQKQRELSCRCRVQADHEHYVFSTREKRCSSSVWVRFCQNA